MYAYNGNGQIEQIAAGNSREEYTYDAFKRIDYWQTYHGNSSSYLIYKNIAFAEPDERSTSERVSVLNYSTTGGFGLTYNFFYDGNGNIVHVTQTGGKNTYYHYDSANQLIREDNEAAGKTWVWTYDDVGNILSKKEYAYTTGTLGSATSTITYGYGNTEWGDLLTSYNGNAFSYDTVGNLMSDGSWFYIWAQGRQLATMAKSGITWTFTYDANGMRTQRTTGGVTYNYTYHGSQLTHMTYGSNSLHFYYDASGKPLSVVYNGTTYYYILSLQGDVVAILNSSGVSVVEYTYDAWGRLLSTTGSMAPSLGLHNPLRYRGYVYDRETGLYYLQSRYYNPTIGRFISADALLSTGQGILGNNMFAYCLNNPVMYQDGTGHSATLITLGIIAIGGLIGMAVSAASSALTQKAINGEVNWKSVGVAAISGFISGAIAASPLGLTGQVIAGGIIGTASYVADCYVNDTDLTPEGFVWSVAMGCLSGRIGGPGANEHNALTNSILHLGKVATREARRQNQAYAQKAVASATSYVFNILEASSWEATIRFSAGCGVANGVTTWISNHRILPDWMSWKPWG